MARPALRWPRMMPAIVSRTTGWTPASGSSSSSSSGCTRSCIDSSSSRCWPIDRFSPTSCSRWLNLKSAKRPCARSCQPVRPRPKAARPRFSHTVSSRKIFTSWKVRPMPRRATSCSLSPPSGVPSCRTLPASACNRLVIRLKTVLLPEPFGPIRPTTLPASTSKLHWLTARRPPNRLVNPRTASLAPADMASIRSDHFFSQAQGGTGL